MGEEDVVAGARRVHKRAHSLMLAGERERTHRSGSDPSEAMP